MYELRSHVSVVDDDNGLTENSERADGSIGILESEPVEVLLLAGWW